MSSLKIAYSERCWARMVGVFLGSTDSSMFNVYLRGRKTEHWVRGLFGNGVVDLLGMNSFQAIFITSRGDVYTSMDS